MITGGSGFLGQEEGYTGGHPTKATLWVKAQHEGALQPPCIVRKDPRVTRRPKGTPRGLEPRLGPSA